jgi:hypothetical protein
MNREELNALPCKAPPTANEADHFIVCDACGQAIDCRNLGDVFHHEVEGHQPLVTQ